MAVQNPDFTAYVQRAKDVDPQGIFVMIPGGAQPGTFGKALIEHQGLRWSLVDVATDLEAARLLTYKAARLKDAGVSFTLAAAQAKLKSGLVAIQAANEAVQIHGGYGYIEEYPVCRFYRDAKILTIGEGTDEVQEMVIARSLGL